MLSPRFLPQIDRYFVRSYALMTLLCACATMALITVGDVFQKMDEFTEYAETGNYGLGVVIWLLVKYYAAFAPSSLLEWLLPLVLLISGVIIVTVTSINNEYTALRAAGISMQRAMLPILVLTLLIGYAVSLSRDMVQPHLLRKASEINSIIRPRATKPLSLPIRDGDEIHFITMGHFDGKTGTAYNLRIEVRNAKDFYDGKESFIAYEAAKAYLQPRTDLVDADRDDDRELQWFPDDKSVKLTQWAYKRTKDVWKEPIPTYITRAMLERQSLGESVMTNDDLNRLSDDLDVQIEKQKRRSEPWVGVVWVLVGLSMVLRQTVAGQEANYVKNMVIAILIAAVIFITRFSCLSMGQDETIGPFLAAWLPNIVFGGIGIWLFLDLER